jgi:hypothetical protein
VTLELTERVTPGVRFESSKGLESDFVDQTRSVACDRMRHHVRSNLPFALLPGCVTGRAGPVSDRTFWLQTLALRPAPVG